MHITRGINQITSSTSIPIKLVLRLPRGAGEAEIHLLLNANSQDDSRRVACTGPTGIMPIIPDKRPVSAAMTQLPAGPCGGGQRALIPEPLETQILPWSQWD